MAIDLSSLDLPTLATREVKLADLQKGPTRAEENDAADKLDAKKLAVWQGEVFARDKHVCRCCGVKVQRTLKRISKRAEANHIKGRADLAVRYDRRNGLTLCLTCHRRVTGNVNDKLVIVGTKFFTIEKTRYIDGDHTVKFKEAA